MSQPPLIYSFVAKGSVVLAEYTPFSGNFSTIAVQCLQNLPSNNKKFTFSSDCRTFNFLVDKEFGTVTEIVLLYHVGFFFFFRIPALLLRSVPRCS